MQLSCADCPDNCCDSYFKHHTYIEWAYLWEGMITFPADKQEIFRQRAGIYLQESEKLLAQGVRPLLMCPLNLDGLCALYSYRLMICRLHGVPSTLTKPDGQRLSFPGCFRAQELTAGMDRPHILDRTDFLLRLVALEKALLGHRIHFLPRVNLTLADMLVKGPPHLS